MRKSIAFLSFAAAIAFCYSCSNDETVAVNDNAASNEISFRPLMTGMTRAADQNFTQATNNATFSVTAFQAGAETNKYFGPLTYTSNGTAFTSADKKYWPKTYNLDFYAYAPIADGTQIKLVKGDGSDDANSYKIFKVTPSTTVANQVDLVYAVTKGWGTYSTPAHNGAAGVTINFRHAESKVIIQLKNTNGSLKFTVGDVSIGNLRGTETFTWNQSTTGGVSPTTAAHTDNTSGYYLDGTWTATSAQTTIYSVTMGTDAYDDDGNNETLDVYRNVFDGVSAANRGLASTAADYEMILIPQALNPQTTYASADANALFNGAYISVQLKIQNKSNNDYLAGSDGAYVTAMWPLTALTWLPGHKYTYTVDLAGGGYHTTNQDTNENLDPILDGTEIKFVTVTVDGWGDAGNTDVL